MEDIPKGCGCSIIIGDMRVIKETQCKSLEGSATLHYLIGTNEAGEIQFKIDKNSGGGFFSNEWVIGSAIKRLAELTTDQEYAYSADELAVMIRKAMSDEAAAN